MGIRPMMSSLLRSKTGPILVALQIAVTLAIVINSLFIVVQRVEKMNRETGMDVANVIIIYARGFGDNLDVVSNIRDDIDLIRSIPGVVTATVSNHVPLSGSGSGTGLRTVADEATDPVATARYQWSVEGLESLGVELARGRNFYEEEVLFDGPGEDIPTPSVIVTQDLADELFPDEDALGRTVYWGDMEASTIVGIVDHMHGSWVNWDKLSNVVIHPGKPASPTNNKYIVRVEPGLRDELMPVIEQRLGESNRSRVIKSVRSLEEMADRSYRRDRGMAIILSIVITLLIALTALVVVGLSSFHVTQRTKQIGTRRALGATRMAIIRQFLLENWVITTAGAALGAVLTVIVAYWLEVSFSLPRLDWRFLPAGILTLWGLSTLAVLEPARRAASVPPAVATRSV